MNQKKIKNYLLEELPKQLINRYGYSKYYTWLQVYKTVEITNPNLLMHITHAYALYCTEDYFNLLMKSINGNETYKNVREEYGVPKDNEIPFFNKPNIDIHIPDFGIRSAGGA